MNREIPVLNMTVGGLIARAVLLLIVIVWTLPTFGLLVSSLRDKDQLSISGWWDTLQTIERNSQDRTFSEEAIVEEDGEFVLEGNIFTNDEGVIASDATIQAWGSRLFLPANEAVEYANQRSARTGFRDYQPGETVTLEDGSTFTLNADGSYVWRGEEWSDIAASERLYFVEQVPPRFTLENYREVLTGESIGRAFVNTFTVTVPATIIPIGIAAFAAYAFAWMQFPFRRVIFAVVVGLLVVPLQMSLIPLIRLYNDVGVGQSYPGIWLAHTGFGLSLAVYLLYNYISGLPREIIESAKIDGASHFSIFVRLILPLSVPALASFAIFQFLWVWNDLLVALVFLGKQDDQIVLTSQIRELIGSRGDNWEILTSSAFVSMIVPILVFFSLQRYFVRGMLAGSVKGG
jgi:alpha-glucoside transport system permease protein